MPPKAEVREDTGFRLSDSVKPVGYRLQLAIDPKEDRFSGRIVIDVQIREAQQRIWLHGDGVTIRRATVRVADEQLAASVRYEPRLELIGVEPSRVLAPGYAVIELDFDASFREDDAIFRRPLDAPTHVFSQFQPISARRAFPCFDEPGFKAPWELAMEIPADLAAFSNTEAIADESVAGDRRRIRFAPTPPLPTYLVAFAVGRFDVILGPSEPIPIRGVLPSAADHDHIAARLETTGALYKLLADYLGPPIELQKLDLVAVPDFRFAAMENPGLFTFHANSLLGERDISHLIAHELVHLWFGNLVTFAWWEDLWLSEAFAWYLPDDAVAALSDGRALVEVHERFRNARSFGLIPNHVEDNAAIRNVFVKDSPEERQWSDSLRASTRLLTAIRFELGPEKFQAVLRRYLDANRDGVATRNEFGAALELVAGRDRADTLMPSSNVEE